MEKPKRTSITFNDKDAILDMGTNNETFVDAPKTAERLEDISKKANERRKREEEREKENQSYKERILENYKTGFDRVGIKLKKNQLEFIESKLKGYIEIRKEWSDLQQEWIEEFLNLLNNNRTEGYDQKMSLYLKSLENLGNEEFRGKVRKNEKLTLEIIGTIFKSVNEGQIRRFNRSLDTYLKSINRILSKRKVN